MPLTDDQKQQLVDAYKRAESSGDTAAMERVRSALAAESAPQQAAAPAQPPTMDQAYQSQTRAAEAQGQVGPTLLGRTAMSIPEGAGQLVLRGPAAFSDSAKAYYDRYNEIVAQNRAAADAKAQGVSQAGDILAGAIPAGGAASTVGKGVGYFRSLFRASSAGALFGASQYAKNDEDRLMNTSLNAALPLATQVVAGAWGGFRNFIVRSVENAKGARTRAVLESAKQFFTGSKAVPDPVGYTPGQETGSPLLQKYEARAAGKLAQEAMATQADQAAARFDEMAQQATRAGDIPATSPAIVEKTHRTVDVLDMAMRTERRKAFVSGMNEVASLPGNNERFRLTNLQQEFEAIRNDAGNEFNIKGDDLPNSFHRVGQAVAGRGPQPAASSKADEALFEALGIQMPKSAREDGLSVMELQKLMAGLGQDRPRGAAILTEAERKLEAYRGRLFAALGQDLDTIGAPSQAMEKLQAVRQTYAKQSDALRRLENDSINRLFGGEESFANPGATLAAFYKLNPADQRYAIDILERRAPDVLRAMQSDRIATALDAAFRPGAAQDSRFDIKAFSDTLFGGRDGLKGSPLWQGKTKDDLLKGAAHLSIIMNHQPHMGAPPLWAEEMTINLVSRSPEFITRAVTRMAYGMNAEKLFFTSAGQQALKTLANTGERSVQGKAQALAWIMSNIDNEEAGMQNGNAQP